jgi:hypothetical protein
VEVQWGLAQDGLVPLESFESARQYILCESDIHIAGILGFVASRSRARWFKGEGMRMVVEWLRLL